MASLWRKVLLDLNTSYTMYRFTRNAYLCRRNFSDAVVKSNNQIPTEESLYLEPEEVPRPDKCESNVSVLQEQTVLEDISDIGPAIDYRSFNFAAFVNDSEVLKKLVDLGVSFYEIEKNVPKPDYLLRLDFERDVQPRIQFLLDHYVPVGELGHLFTANPYFFMNSLSNLQIRINYLEYKNFSPELIARVISGNPIWLNYSTIDIDKKLGFLQKEFKMTGSEVRTMLNNEPTIVNTSQEKIIKNLFELKEIQQFTFAQCKRMLIICPLLWKKWKEDIAKSFDFLALEMGISKRLIAADPIALTKNLSLIQNRHSFLKALGRAQYDPKMPNYVSMKALCVESDAEFCENVSKTSIQTYNLFLKTL